MSNRGEIEQKQNGMKNHHGLSYATKIILSFVTIPLTVLAINLMNYPWDTTYAIYIIGLYVILTSLSQVFRAIFRAFEVIEYELLIIILEKL